MSMYRFTLLMKSEQGNQFSTVHRGYDMVSTGDVLDVLEGYQEGVPVYSASKVLEVVEMTRLG